MGTDAAGMLLREWRQRRRYSQLELAHAAEVSAKHLSYVETGRSRPSPEMIVHLCNHLDVPLRERNILLLAAGHAPRYSETTIRPDAPSDLSDLIALVLDGHRYPAFAVDAHWNLIAANNAAAIFLTGVEQHLLNPPINVIRLSLHPDGLAKRITNIATYATHTLDRLQRQHSHHPSPTLASILNEFDHLTGGQPVTDGPSHSIDELNIPIELAIDETTTIRLVSTITTFGAPRDVTASEIAIESFYPADPASRAWLDQTLTQSADQPLPPVPSAAEMNSTST